MLSSGSLTMGLDRGVVTHIICARMQNIKLILKL